jgi:hypothetical protein
LLAFHEGLKPAVEALADDWEKARRSAPNDKVIILTKTNAESRAVASVLRDRLKCDGALDQREILLPAADASGNVHTLPIAVGEHLIALRRNDRLGVVNGTPLVVEAVNVDRAKTITISARRGDDIIKHRVELISFAEPLAKDDTGDMFRKFIGIVNEYQSRETSRATTRTMKENARRGYSNGGIIPFGYRSFNVEIIGTKQKKRLEIEPVEANIVELAFRLASEGDGTSGPSEPRRSHVG